MTIRKELSILCLLASLCVCGKEHQVQRGETFESISKTYGITVDELRELNPKLKRCYVGITLKIPENKHIENVSHHEAATFTTPQQKSNSSEHDINKESKKNKVNGWDIAKGILGLIGDATQAYVNIQNQSGSQSNSQVQGFLSGLMSNTNQPVNNTNQPVDNTPHSTASPTSAKIGIHLVNQSNPSHHYIVAQNNQINYSFDDKVVKRYQEIYPNCIVDVKEYADYVMKSGYYKCQLCHGSLICSVCEGKGRIGAYNNRICACNGTGKCSCVGPEASMCTSNFGMETVYFPGWELAFCNTYDRNGRKISGENFAQQERESRQAERDKRQKSMSTCSVCHGTGIDPNPTTLQPSITFIGHYHSGHEKCQYCLTYSEHWHSKCTHCMGKVAVD